MATYDLGKVVGDPGEKGDDGSTIWYTSTAPTYASSKYTFTISNLTGRTGAEIAVNDIIFYSTYYYIVSAVNTTTVDCSTRVSIKGSDASVTIVDNLTSTSSTSALSAKQGKVLNDNKIETSSIATSFGSTTSDSKVPSEKLVKTSLDAKQATLVSGTNIKTINNNSLLGSGNITIESGSNVDIVTSWSGTTSDSKVPSEKLAKDSLDGKANSSHTHTKSQITDFPTIPSASSTVPSADTTSGSYGSGTSYARSNHTHPKSTIYAEASHSHTKSEITDFPSIPSSSSDLSDGSDLIKKSNTSGLLKNDGTVMTSGTGSSNYSAGNHTHTGYISTSSTTGLIKNDGSIMTSGTGSTNYAAGNHTHSGYISTSSTTGLIKNDGTVMTSGTGSSNYAAGNHTHSGYVSTSDIADNLTTNDSTKVLSAKQGKALNDLIGSAISYINQ